MDNINQIDQYKQPIGYWDGMYRTKHSISYVKGFFEKGRLINGYCKRLKDVFYPNGYYVKNYEDWGYSLHPLQIYTYDGPVYIELIFH